MPANIMKSIPIAVRATNRMAALACLAFFLNGCGHSGHSGPSNQVADPMLIEPRLGVGKIRAGMTPGQIEQVLGHPNDKTLDETVLFYHNLGFQISIRGGVVSVVNCETPRGTLFPNAKEFTGRTKEGIGMGSSRAEVIKAFGQPSKVLNGGGFEYLDYHEKWLMFGLTEGRVHRIKVGLQAFP